ncbi:receptor-like protein 7 [Arachis duranensis]|uniref:Receptor-like protein 7 n=1 Tax=Arachis duranensis TaxID=130453 RepID=A0A9C6TSR5_ARADU|nr:receptor-like protein 7 [Arachis duranensis]
MRTTPNSWFYFISLLCLVDLTITINLATAHYCLDHQQSLLLHLKNNLTYNQNQSKKLIHWNHVHDCCHWKGVSCNKGHVIALDLSQESISGGNFSSLFHMQFLQSLNLAYNEFISFETCSEFQNLKNLRYLNLSNAGIVGEIPKNIFQLSSLQVLDLSDNQRLNGSLPQNIPYQLASLNYLNLSHTNSFGPLLESLLNLRQLSTLDLSNCQFNGTLPNSMSNLTHLVYLDLSFNNFTGPLPSFNRSNALRSFALNHNYFSGTIPSTHFNGLANLVRIDFGDNSLDGRVPSTLFALPSLQQLILSYNRFEGPLKELPNCSSSSLEMLDLSGNNFQGSIPSSIFQLKRLLLLQLSTNKFSGTIKLDKLRNLPNLKTFDLSHNNLSVVDANVQPVLLLLVISIILCTCPGHVVSGLCLDDQRSFLLQFKNNLTFDHQHSTKLNSWNESIACCDWSGVTCDHDARVIALDLSHTKFSGRLPLSIGTIPPSIFQLRGLVYLRLSKNKLSGPMPLSIQFSGLHELDLSSNKFSGPMLIDALALNRNLSVLDLSFNMIDDVIVTDVLLSTFPQLRILNLAFCNLKTFPAFLKYQSGLYDLYLSYNQIQGIVPNWIWRLDELSILNVSHNSLTNFENLTHNLHNQLQGPIQGFLQLASIVDFSSNNLSSVIPVDIGYYMSRTLYLSLANNSFHGSIPHSLCNASMLEVLDLSHNKISGELPHCLMKIGETLWILNLGSNNLTGHIPNTFPSSCSLRTIVFNGNQLAGPLPNSLAHCDCLDVLDIGINKITGGFPCFLRNISALRILILQNNEFHGPMRCGKESGVWEMIQIVDVAFNHFSGKLPGIWFTNWKVMMSNEGEAQSKAKHLDFQLRTTDVQDSVMVISKGQKIELLKILTIFTSIDFSYNQFEGPIPKELMDFKALHLLNLSHNALSGQIPSSIGNLNQLESLDLSMNSLEGEIPTELANLNFLSYLNLSFNHLTGKIPTGTQLQSFEASSFEGNDGLYGPPLTKSPNHGMHALPPPEMPQCGSLACEVQWNLVSAEMGLVFGLGIVFGPLLFRKRWRMRYCQFLDKILCRIFPQLTHDFERHGGQSYKVLVWRRN